MDRESSHFFPSDALYGSGDEGASTSTGGDATHADDGDYMLSSTLSEINNFEDYTRVRSQHGLSPVDVTAADGDGDDDEEIVIATPQYIRVLSAGRVQSTDVVQSTETERADSHESLNYNDYPGFAESKDEEGEEVVPVLWENPYIAQLEQSLIASPEDNTMNGSEAAHGAERLATGTEKKEQQSQLDTQQRSQSLSDLEAGVNRTTKMHCQRIFMDSISIHFYPDTFLLQFAVHMFFPLAYICVNYRAQQFWGTGFFGLLINIYTPLIAYAVIITFFLAPHEDREVFFGAFVLPIILFSQHKLIVALKYASLSRTEYAKFQKCTDMELSGRWSYQMMLFLGWYNRDPLLIAFELGSAAARIGAKINEIFFYVADPNDSINAMNEFVNWHALLTGQHRVQSISQSGAASALIPQEDGTFLVSVYDLCRAFVTNSDKSAELRYWIQMISVWSYTACNLAVPFVEIAYDPHFAGRSVFIMIFLGLSTILNFLYGFIAFNLLFIAVWDIFRLVNMVKFLHRMIRVSDIQLDTKISFKSHKKDEERVQRKLEENMAIIMSVTMPSAAAISAQMLCTAETCHIEENEVRKRFQKNVAGDKSNTSAHTKNKAEEGGGKLHAEYSIREFVKSLRPPGTTGSISSDIKKQNDDSNVTSMPSRTVTLQRTKTIKSQRGTHIGVESPERKLTRMSSRRDQLKQMSSMREFRSQRVKDSSLPKMIPNQFTIERTLGQPLSRSIRMRNNSGVSSARPSIDSTVSFGESTSANSRRKKPGTHTSSQNTRRFSDYGNKGLARELDPVHLPKVSFRVAQNVVSWTYSRLVIQHFGERFRVRVDIYAGGTTVLMFVLMVLNLVGIIIAESPEDILRQFETTFFYQSMITIIMIFLFTLVITTGGAIINEELAVHSRTMSAHVLRIRDEMLIIRKELQVLSEMDSDEEVSDDEIDNYDEVDDSAALPGNEQKNDPEERRESARQARRAQQRQLIIEEQEDRERLLEELQEAWEMIESCRDIADSYTNLKPLKMLGIKIYASTVATIFTTGVSYFTVLYSIYSSAQTQLAT